jgi:TatD DNase family protein
MIDSHCHLDHEFLLSNLDDVIKRSKEVGINKILTICTTFESYTKIKEIVKKDQIIFGTYGIHPHEAKDNKVTSDLIIEEINNSKKIIGIGETGLDFYYNHTDKHDQIKSLEEHINASIELDIPLIIHSRNAENETLDIFNNYKNKKIKILMHCFTGSKKFAEKLLDLNAYFSASGIITFKNSTELQETFKFIPLEKLLIETDSPFLAPVPNRGKKNEPSFIKYTAEKLADIKNISNKDLIKITSLNFNNLFN